MMKMSQVISVLLLSRLLTTVIAVLGDWLFVDHISSDAYKNQLDRRYAENGDYSIYDELVYDLFKPFTSWDAQYFVEIGHDNGYSREQMLAFFPMFPRMMHFFGLLLHSTVQDAQIALNFHSCLLLSAYIINIVAFVVGGCFLYKLTRLFFNSHTIGRQVLLLYAYNPASVFFTAFYTESLFFCFTVLGLYCLYRFQSLTLAIFFFSLSSYTRSNGIVSVGYIIFYVMISHSLTKSSSGSEGSIKQKLLDFAFDYVNFVVFQVKSLFALLSIFGTFYMFQHEAYRIFCNSPAQDEPTEVENLSPAWCNSFLGLSYSSVQNQYWEVGFLRYWQWKKIPNFIIAAPILATHIVAAGYFFIHLSFAYLEKQSMYDLYPRFINPRFVTKKWHKTGVFNQLALIPFVIHALFLSLFCTFFMHIEVANRFLFSSSIWTYWSIAGLIESQCLGSKWTNLLYYSYFFVYFFGGTVAFANFLPFT